MNSIRLYAQAEPYGLLVRTGKAFANITKAKARAKELRALQVEVRDINKPWSRSLLAIFREGQEIGQ